MSVGGNLRTLRNAAQLTQEQLAGKAGVTQSDLSKWETNKSTPDLKSALKVSTALECSLDAIVEGLAHEYDKQRDLLRHAKGTGSILHKGGSSDVPASGERHRISELETELKLYRAALVKVAHAARDITDIASIADEGDPVAAATASHRRSRGKTRRRSA